MIDMDEDIEKFKILFECYNQPDIKLTKGAIVLRDELYDTITKLYHSIKR